MTNFISGRVRLARNLSEYPFPSMMNKNQADEIIQKVWDAFSNTPLKNNLKLIRSDDADKVYLSSLIEKHLISPDFLQGTLPRAVILSEDNSISIMINEEDHIRIQVFTQTDSLTSAYETADKIDTLLAEKLNIAFHEKFGFLTACPTNAGTGMRASFMLHLPAITMTGSISSVLSWASKLSLAMRGVYGEHSKAKGAFYQLSNQITLGSSEKDIISRLNIAAKELCEKEEMVKNALMENNRVNVTDKCMRSYGILTNAYTLSSDEVFSLASDVILGISLGIINNITPSVVTNALFDTMPSCLVLENPDCAKDATLRDITRAEKIKKSLSK